MPRGGSGLSPQSFWTTVLKVGITVVVGVSFALLIMLAWLSSIDTMKISQPFDNMKFVGSVAEGSEEFLTYTDI